MKRTLAGAAAAVLVLLWAASPAQAASPSVEFRTPANNQRFSVPAFAFDATVAMPSGGTVRGNVTVSWFSPENRPVPGTTTHASNNANSVPIQIPDRVFPWNGTYRVDVTATGRDGMLDQSDETATRSSQFVIDAPPAPPGGITTAVNAQREVSVAWNGNGEPDLVGYEVQRQLGSDPWQQVTVTGKGTTSALDRATSQVGGTYRYRVVAFRSSAEVGKLNPSTPSSTSTARVPAPPVTTTTTTSTTTTTAPPGEGEAEEPRGGGRSGSGGSTGGRTGSGPSTGSSGGRTTATTLASSGKVDLSGFSSLLEQARRSGQTAPAPAEEEDGGYDEKLPFSGRARRDSGGDPGDSAGNEVAIIEEGIADDGTGPAQSLAFLAGGLLATVLVMHLLWVRSELHRVEVLEAVAPEPAIRPRRRRPVPVEDA